MARYFNFLFLFLLSPIFCLGQMEQQNNTAETQVENIIKSLPEVKALDDVYDSVSNRHQRVKWRILQPFADSPFYKAEVGYQGSSRFEPHYYFYVNPETNVILIEDLKYGDRPTLAEWRKRQLPNYQKEDTLMNSNALLQAPKADSIFELPAKPKADFIYKK